MFGFKLKRRRADLARTLADDVTQPGDWDGWLAAATSIDHLHATCPHPGWLVYCAYWDGVSQDRMLDAALALAAIASERDPRAPLSPAVIRSLRDDDGPELGELILSLEHHPLTRHLVDVVPTQLNVVLQMAIGEERRARRRDAPPSPPDLGPFRHDPTGFARAELDAIVAAGYVLTIEAIFHRQQHLRESVATRAAAAAQLLHGSFAGFRDEALAIQRAAYRWERRG